MAVATVVLAGFAAVALWSLKDAKRTRHGASIPELSRRWDSPRIQESMRRLLNSYGASRVVTPYETLWARDQPSEDELKCYLDDYYCIGRWPNLMETIGVLHRDKALSPEVVYMMWGAQINVAWEIWEDAVQSIREITGAPTSSLYFEDLAKAMREQAKREAKRTASVHRSQRDPGH